MTDKAVWFITGAGRGMGVDFVHAALEAGKAVVATGRDPGAVRATLPGGDDVLVVQLDVTRPEDAEAAVGAALERFGRIDVLVNNAANFYGGYFEELSNEQIQDQLATALMGPVNVTRSVLPVMRRQRRGHIVAISSGAGLSGLSSTPPMPPPSSVWKAGWSPCVPRLRRLGSPRRLSTPGSSAPSC